VLLWVKFRNSFQARSQSCETRLLASSCLPVCLSVRPFVYLSVRTNNSVPTRRIFMKFHVREFSENESSKFVSSKSDKNNGSSTEYLNLFMKTRSNMHRMRNVSDTLVEKPKHARILCSISFFPKIV